MILGAMIHHYDNEKTVLFSGMYDGDLHAKVATWCEQQDPDCCDPTSARQTIKNFMDSQNGDWMYLTQEDDEL